MSGIIFFSPELKPYPKSASVLRDLLDAMFLVRKMPNCKIKYYIKCDNINNNVILTMMNKECTYIC